MTFLKPGLQLPTSLKTGWWSDGSSGRQLRQQAHQLTSADRMDQDDETLRSLQIL